MNTCCELSYNKNYNNATICRTISDVSKLYDPLAFAKWLTDAFMDSPFKSWQQIAYSPELRGVRGATRSTLSRYAGAKPQLLTNQPSQPNPELVIALAKVFDKDINEALRIAGHAPIPKTTKSRRTVPLSEPLQNALHIYKEKQTEFIKN